MPRDLFPQLNKETEKAPELTTSPDTDEELKRRPAMDMNKTERQQQQEEDSDENLIRQFSGEVPTMSSNASTSKRDQLHPITQSLTLADIDSCTLLEEATFPENERCTREKFHYRLKTCGELSLGIFSSLEDSQTNAVTFPTSAPVYSGAPNRKAVLLGHIVATKTTNPVVRDEDMAIPSNTSLTSSEPDSDGVRRGHKEDGRTIAVHSLAVLPEYQGRGLGKTLVRAFLQRLESQGVGDRCALLSHEGLVPYYESLGFENKGRSEASFGGGGWFDLVRVFGQGGDESD